MIAHPTPAAPEDIPSNWGRCLEVILAAEFGPGAAMDDEASGLYRLEITETASGKDVYYIQLLPNNTVTAANPNAKRATIGTEDPSGGREPDVSVSVSSPDLAQVLDGSLAPLQAYLTGRISATGDVRKLMFFDRLSKRGHRAGSMFTV